MDGRGYAPSIPRKIDWKQAAYHLNEENKKFNAISEISDERGAWPNERCQLIWFQIKIVKSIKHHKVICFWESLTHLHELLCCFRFGVYFALDFDMPCCCQSSNMPKFVILESSPCIFELSSFLNGLCWRFPWLK